jgi:hypothetical protein
MIRGYKQKLDSRQIDHYQYNIKTNVEFILSNNFKSITHTHTHTHKIQAKKHSKEILPILPCDKYIVYFSQSGLTLEQSKVSAVLHMSKQYTPGTLIG